MANEYTPPPRPARRFLHHIKSHWQWWIGVILVPIFIGLLTTFGKDIFPFPNPGTQEEEWRGISFEPVSNKLDPHDFTEYTLHISLDDTEVKGKMTRPGTDRQWIITGYRKGENIGLAYRTTKQQGVGVGTITLKYNAIQNAYFGHWTTVDCDVGKVLKCQYLLTKPAVSKTSALSLYTQHINSTTKCQPVHIESTQCAAQ